MSSMARIRMGTAGILPRMATLALSLLLSAAPGVAAAGPPHASYGGGHAAYGGHFGAGGRPPALRGGMRLAEGPHGFGGPRSEGRFEGGPRYQAGHIAGGPRYEGRFGGPRFEGGARYVVPPHWVGMHPHWEGGPRPGPWVRPWGPRWAPHYWYGGYWGGVFWPHVYVDWDFPWFLGALPLGYATYWWGGVPYYYWRGVYYVWSPDYAEYVVTDPPPVTGGTVEGAEPPASAQAATGNGRGAMSLYVYPKKGQSDEQTQSDRYQCHEWAVHQTGFDPTDTANDTPSSTATPENYKRAFTACLDARGYSVR